MGRRRTRGNRFPSLGRYKNASTGSTPGACKTDENVSRRTVYVPRRLTEPIRGCSGWGGTSNSAVCRSGTEDNGRSATTTGPAQAVSVNAKEHHAARVFRVIRSARIGECRREGAETRQGAGHDSGQIAVHVWAVEGHPRLVVGGFVILRRDDVSD